MIEFRNQEPVRYDQIEVGDLITFTPDAPEYGYYKVKRVSNREVFVDFYADGKLLLVDDHPLSLHNDLDQPWRVKLWE